MIPVFHARDPPLCELEHKSTSTCISSPQMNATSWVIYSAVCGAEQARQLGGLTLLTPGHRRL
jgi:hypothetical protein